MQGIEDRHALRSEDRRSDQVACSHVGSSLWNVRDVWGSRFLSLYRSLPSLSLMGYHIPTKGRAGDWKEYVMRGALQSIKPLGRNLVLTFFSFLLANHALNSGAAAAADHHDDESVMMMRGAADQFLVRRRQQ